MSECVDENCDHSSHGMATAEIKEERRGHHAIITPQDIERWPLLECPSQPCSLPISDTDAAMIGKMDAILDVLGDSAAGLAAVQIGYPKRIFLLREAEKNRAFINPIIVSRSRETKKDGEACLSLPGFGAVFKRPKRVELQYHELDGEVKREVFTGFSARVIMHEMNHLDGILITHHLEKQVSEQQSRTKFGMLLTPNRCKVIADRRARNKRAKASRKANRG